MIKRKLISLSLGLFLLPTALMADGQDGLVFILDAFTLLAAVFCWTILFFVFLLLFKFVRKRENSKGRKIIIGIICLFFAAFQFVMTKSDTHPYEGPIDEFIHRDKIRAWRIQDSLEIWRGKSDSTIETTIASIDKNQIGVYIWLHGKSIFVRKLTPNLGSQKQNDSLTMSIVRSWKK